MSQDRRASFKLPPASVRSRQTAQELRRARALEEQKRRRAERFDSTRQLDIFADLSLGHSDDEANDGAPDNVVREGISQFATMLPPLAPQPLSVPTPSESEQPPAPESSMQTQEKKRGKNKRKGKGRSAQDDQSRSRDGQGKHKAGKPAKPSKWADKCMYAELLEMKDGFDDSGVLQDGIPPDIETGWVAVTPIPVGKRCLAVTHQTSGIAGVVPNTTIRSRVLGKPLMKPFPSTLPPQTVLDCILDDNWRDNGILHVLDVISWKGQDVADCETPFRFWWRDTRLSELDSFPPPPNAAPSTAQSPSQPDKYQFPHPTTFAPIPYHTDTSLPQLLSTLVPLTRTTRTIPITISEPSPSDEAAMDTDSAPSLVQLHTVQAQVQSDGLLLYVAQASYEPGTSPLSNWIPLRAYQTREEQQQRGLSMAASPLDVFEGLVRRRLALGASSLPVVPEVEMES
ncbi:hypothetical protein L227DRAFT_206130 [Lentinus tigrinus ALCF2SS1-6]|uniref:Snurportin-1 n=1 Tax=Lentinus tigrinus ALCF2SS1-6 TaxID=1328759 RepID=A0A5C2SQ81_9APHY|nr:hypothetical protein L227DRAFT_206130 [Lentinus tigrinus ALCF2SS1-6]